MRDFCITKCASVTPDDDVDLEFPGIGLYVGVSGDVTVDTLDGSTVTMVGLASGVWHPIEVKRIYATDTDADNILVGW